MRAMRLVLTLWAALWMAGAGLAHEHVQALSALARFQPEASEISVGRRTLTMKLALSQPVPYRVYTLDAPARLVIDFREVDWGDARASMIAGVEDVPALRFGGVRPGWSRLVMELGAPLALARAQMERVNEGAVLDIGLKSVAAEEFAALSGLPESGDWPKPQKPRKAPKRAGDGVLIVLDPGHGGIDPGASREGVNEKDLMLRFAREIAEELRRVEGVDVLLTREDDSFVSLERRVAIAHEAGADLFLSLHADALSEGRAHGATVHTLSDEASDRASALLVERHDHADLLAGVDLSGQDDEIADVLLDLARQETKPRSERLAKAIVIGLESRAAPMNRRPYRSAGFSVLKAADIPSVLLEIGFMSSERDFQNITDDAWRRKMAQGIRDGIQAWMIADEAIQKVKRK